MLYLSLFLLLVCNIIVVSFIPNKYLRGIIAFLLNIFWLIQVSAVYIGGSFFDYKYFCHLNLSTLSMIKGFVWETVLTCIALVLLPYLIIRLAHYLQKHARPYLLCVKWVVLVASIVLFTYSPRSMGRELANVIRILSAGQGDLESNPIYLELPKKQQLQTSKGAYKNIIVLSLESFERGYLHPSNHYITPHLQALKKTWNYSDMRVTTGCAFTSASLYASMTGLPSLFPGNGNNYFYGATNYKLISLPAILANCGYETYFFSNNADFAGTKELLGALGVHHVLHGTFGGKYAESPYGGTYDKDLLNEAKQIAAQHTEQPYFIFISTIQTHSPNGVLDTRVTDVIGKEKTDLETAVKSTDYLVHDFINYLDSLGALENTALFIYPDHLFYGERDLFLHHKEPRSLWLMSNQPLSHCVPTPLYQIDIPKVILEACGIKHNNKFLSDIIPEDMDKNHYVDQHLNDITSINIYALEREMIMSESFTLRTQHSKLRCKINNHEYFSYPINKVENKYITLLFDNKLKALQTCLLDSMAQLPDTYAYFESYITIKSHSDKTFDIAWHTYPDNRTLYQVSNVKEAELYTQDIVAIIQAISEYTINAPLATFENKGYPVASTTYPSDTLSHYLEATLQDASNIVFITAYDDASLQFANIRPILSKAGLTVDLSDKFRYEYVAAIGKDTVYFEKTDYRLLYRRGTIDNCPYIITSCGYDHIHTSLICGSHIVINDKDYSTYHRGLNFVIYNKDQQQVIDAFFIDTNADPTLTIQRR